METPDTRVARVHVSRLPLLLGLVLGCEEGPDQAQLEQQHRDRLAYAEAAAAPTEPERCEAIALPDLRLECLVFAAGSLAQANRGAEARELCQQIPRGHWHDECVFTVVDASNLRGAEARSACRETGPYHDRCLGHALRREAAELIPRYPPGQEAALLDALEEVAKPYFPSSARDRAERFVIQLLASREPDTPFDRVHCGGMDDRMCSRVYIERILLAARAQQHSMNLGDHDLPWSPACSGGPVPIARAEALGLPTWEPEMDPIVQRAWRELCQ